MDKEEAMKILKDFHDKSALFSVRTALETLHPELKESEDERIRKEIMDFIDTKTIESDERRNRWFSYFEKYKPISFTSLEDTEVKMSLMRYISELNQDVVHIHPDIVICNKWIAWLEKQGESNPYSGISFDYNGHTWGMCARDDGVDILFNKKLIQHISSEKQGEQKETNLIEILKHYPKETELYSPLYGRLWLAEVDEKNEIITCYKHHLEEGCTRAVLEQEDIVSFYSNGTTGLSDFNISKDCMLFLYDITKQGNLKQQDKSIFESIKEEKINNTNKFEQKFKVGDWITNGACTIQITSIDDRYYWHDNDCVGGDIESIDKEYHLWTIKDANPGDVLYHKAENGIEYIVMNKGLNEHNNIDSYFRYNSVNGFGTDIPSVLSAKYNSITPATKEQRDLLFSKMHEAGYKWNAEKKELRKIELTDVDHEYYSELLKNDKSDNIADYAYQCAYCMSHDWANETPTWDDVQKACKLGAEWNKKRYKSTWSEEDEKILKDILVDVKFEGYNNDMLANSYKKINWLKSLKEKFKIQTRQGISKEDEYSFMIISSLIRQDQDLSPKDKNKLRDWLKSIIYQSHWKPSDEQMEALFVLLPTVSYGRNPAFSLYNDLRKLKGE